MKKEIDPNEKATAELKGLFRGRKVWKDFCEQFRDEKKNECAVCGKKLTKVIGNVHHLHSCPTMADYMNLDKSRYMLLCTNCHEWCHAIANSPRFKELGLANRKHDGYLDPEPIFQDLELMTKTKKVY